MTAQVDTAVRGPEAYALARRVISEMEAARVWPTPLNFELWLHYLGDPEGPLGREIQRLLESETSICEETSERLARFLPRSRMGEEIHDAGVVLDRELATVAEAIAKAHKTQVDYGETLAGASQTIDASPDGEALKAVVGGLSTATRKVRRETAILEKRLESSNREVARLRENLEQVRRDAMTDALTRLANRKAFDERLDETCAQDEQAPMCLAVIDIDHFKRFNDTWGHQTGDQVLRYVGSVLARVCGGRRFAARFGGEEFAIIFPGESSAAVSVALESIRQEVASRALRRRSTNDDLGAITLSAGFAQRLPGESPVALLGRADAALYASKRGGRNRITSAPALENAA